MTNEDLMAKVYGHAHRLAELMYAPEPGLISWSSLVHAHAQFISDWWAGKFAKNLEDSPPDSKADAVNEEIQLALKATRRLRPIPNGFIPGDGPFCITPDGVLIAFYQAGNQLEMKAAMTFAETYNQMSAGRNTMICPRPAADRDSLATSQPLKIWYYRMGDQAHMEEVRRAAEEDARKYYQLVPKQP